MRSTGLFLLLTASLFAADVRVDHATVCGENLKQLQANLAAAGIQSEYGGPHSNHATEMALTSFPDGSYLELIAIQPAGDPSSIARHEWIKPMRANGGPCAWAARSSDVTAEVARLKAAGITVGAPEKSGRNRPDGQRLDWETAQIGTATRGVFFPFLIRDFTSRDLRAFPSGKPTSTRFQGISKVVIAVRDLPSAVSQYRKAFGLPEPKRQTDAAFGANLAWLEGTPAVLASPMDAKSWLAARIQQIGEGPCAYILSGPSTVQSSTSWFGKTIVWVDNAQLGWRLGIER